MDGKNLKLEKSDCQVIKDSSSYWCYIDLEHNSTFYLSGKKLVNMPIAKQTIKLSNTKYVYNGKYKKPTVTVSGLKKNADYTVAYSNNKPVGRGTVTIKGKGKYGGTVVKNITIAPKSTYITRLSKGNKSFTVKWKKQPGKMATSRITGYQYRYSTSSKMTNATIKTVKGYSKTSAKKTGLKAKKKYYVQVRTYKTVKGVKYYSSWSKAKAVKTK